MPEIAQPVPAPSTPQLEEVGRSSSDNPQAGNKQSSTEREKEWTNISPLGKKENPKPLF